MRSMANQSLFSAWVRSIFIIPVCLPQKSLASEPTLSTEIVLSEKPGMVKDKDYLAG